MSINVDEIIPRAEQITAAEAARIMRPRGSRKELRVETVRKWANPKHGCKVGGQTLVLMSVRVGGDIITCKRWVEAFERARFEAGLRGGVREPPQRRSPAKRRAAHRRAERALDAAGVGGKKGA